MVQQKLFATFMLFQGAGAEDRYRYVVENNLVHLRVVLL
jgi:hypothetical protein